MTTITQKQVSAMKAAQDLEAAAFWAYPDAAWQAAFQADWLQDHVGVRSAQGPDGLVFGEES